MTKKTTDLVNDSTLQEFRDLTDQGNDFFKIELLRPAKKCYQQAMKFNIEPEMVKHKIAECDRLLAFEMRIVWILSVSAVAAVIIWIIFK